MGNLLQDAINSVDSLSIGGLSNSSSVMLYYLKLVGRPIGVITKNYDNIKNTLYSNEGNGSHSFDGYGTPIGSLANTELNQETTPWFFSDKEKSDTSDYLNYVDTAFFSDNGKIEPLTGLNETSASNFLYSSLDVSKNKVGVIRNYDIDSNYDGAKTLEENGALNPNSASKDTRLGIINNFYLNATLKSSNDYTYSKSGSYADPTYGDSDLLVKNGFSITQGAYSNFGLDGAYGMSQGEYRTNSGTVLSQTELIGEIIPWSTADHWYDSARIVGGSSNNVDFVKTILGTDSDTINVDFADLAQDVNNGNFYGAFGNYYSITYSLGLTQTSGSKTQEFITKSMFGYDLLDERYSDVKFEYEDGDTTYSDSGHTSITGKKYYVGQGTRGTNYIDKMTAIDVTYDEEVIEVDGRATQVPIRYQLMDVGNDNLWSTKALYTYAEAANKNVTGSPLNNGTTMQTYNGGVEFGRHAAYSINITNQKKDLVNYTNERFLLGKFGTLIGRFHSDDYESRTEARAARDMISTAISQYGMSRGRNLLKSNHGANTKSSDGEGYDNPYCRVWTFHHQYSKLSDLIRPFGSPSDFENSSISTLRARSGHLGSYGVVGSNGLVRYAPSSSDNIKKCMFSIENLAWKHETTKGKGITTGPNGGRIMWFPPYDLRFNESVNVDWSSSKFIGRGEQIYSYVNTERSGSLDFTILVDHPAVINSYAGSIRGGDGIGDVDDTESNEQSLLRFFAGCQILSSVNGSTSDTTTSSKRVKDTSLASTTYEYVYFYVFFPNNYGGEDDSATGDIRPMWYLANGLTAQQTKISDTSSGLQSPLATTLSTTYSKNGKQVGGYEMRENSGITVNLHSGTDGSISAGTVTDDTSKKEISLTTIKHKNKNGKYNYWYYRVDSRTAHEVLNAPNRGKEIDNYEDSTSFQLNSTGYKLLTKYHTNASQWDSDGSLYSFADVFCALESNGEKILDGLYNDTNVKALQSLFKTYDVAEVIVDGYASAHGYTKSNQKLARARAESVKAWLVTVDPTDFKGKTYIKTTLAGPALSHHNINKLDAKVWRCAKVSIKFQKEAITTGIDNINYYDNETQRAINWAVGKAKETDAKSVSELESSVSTELTNVQKVAVTNQIEQNNAEADAEAEKASNTESSSSGEYNYFSELQNNDPFLHSKIVEKIKYFDPAFHSITPEGFNERLTFLHQCTRQGNTNSLSDHSGVKTASNLSFGSPPVCILRVGDFYNTRIVIDSMSINYDNASWDLNPEGIGVMPMMAKVTLNFKFLGGSDISGPIKKLQNAVTFNYYANTSVYDSNSDVPS